MIDEEVGHINEKEQVQDEDRIKLRSNTNLNYEKFNKDAVTKVIKKQLIGTLDKDVEIDYNFNNKTNLLEFVNAKIVDNNNIKQLEYYVDSNKNLTPIVEDNKKIAKTNADYYRFQNKHKKRNHFANGGVTNNFDYLSYYSFSNEVSLDDVKKWLSDPEANWKSLVSASKKIKDRNGIYKILNRYMRNMANFISVVRADFKVPQTEINLDEFQTLYFEVQKMVDDLNLEYEGVVMNGTLFEQGFSVAYLQDTENGKTFVPIPFDYVIIDSKDAGCYNAQFDLTTLGDLEEDDEDLLQFPLDVQAAYLTYKKLSSAKKELKENYLYRLAPENTIVLCFDDFLYPVPYFMYLLEDIYNLEDYKSLTKQNTESSILNYLIYEIPLNEKSGNKDDLLISREMLETYMAQAEAAINGEVPIVPALKGLTPVQFKVEDNIDKLIDNATEQIYDDSGINRAIFNTDSVAGMPISLKKDEQVIYDIYRQYECWVNRRIKILNLNSDNIIFKFKLLDCTHFSVNEMKAQKMSEMTVSNPTTIQDSMALNRASISENIGTSVLMNDVFKVTTHWTPLTSIHTSSGNNDTTTNINNDSLNSTNNKTESVVQ